MSEKTGSELRRRLVRVDKVGGEIPFALDVDDSSESDAVSHALHNLGCFLRHLEIRV